MIDSMKNAFCLKDKVAIITGGDTGIGFGIATAMAEQGANIAIFCRRQDRAEDALQKLAPLGGTYKWYKTDITDYAWAAPTSGTRPTSPTMTTARPASTRWWPTSAPWISW